MSCELCRHVRKLRLGGLIQRVSSVSLCSPHPPLHTPLSPLPSTLFRFICFHPLLAQGIRLTSIYTLRCCGDTASWDIFTSLLAPPPPPSPTTPFHPPRALRRLVVVAYFYVVTINSPTGLVSDLNVICGGAAEAIKCFQGPGSLSNMADCV